MRKFALVGCGGSGKLHAEIIKGVGELIAVCDVVREKADAFASAYGSIAYVSVEDLLANEKAAEAVVICTPTGLHAEHVIKSLQARKHVLCESPLCLTTAAAWQIIETEKFCRRKLFIADATRYNPLLQTVRQQLADGTLGKILAFQLHYVCSWSVEDYLGWKGTLFPGGGTLYTEFSTAINVLTWLFGEVAEVRGFKNRLSGPDNSEVEDIGTVALQMQNGTLGSLNWMVNTNSGYDDAVFTIVAEKGTIRIGGKHLNDIQLAPKEAPFHSAIPSEYKKDKAVYDGSATYQKQVYDNLIGVLENARQGFTGSFDGLRTVTAIEKIYKALAER